MRNILNDNFLDMHSYKKYAEEIFAIHKTLGFDSGWNHNEPERY